MILYLNDQTFLGEAGARLALMRGARRARTMMCVCVRGGIHACVCVCVVRWSGPVQTEAEPAADAADVVLSCV